MGLGLAAALAGGCAAGSGRGSISSSVASPKRAGSVRIAHLTDFHVEPELGAPRGMTMCLHHVQSQKHKPDLIFNTGDCVMNTLSTTRDRTQVQWDEWNR